MSELPKAVCLQVIGEVHAAAQRHGTDAGMLAHLMTPDVALGDREEWTYALAPIPLPPGVSPSELLTTMELDNPSPGFCTHWAGMLMSAPAVIGDDDQDDSAMFGPGITDDRPIGRMTVAMRRDGMAWALIELPGKGYRIVDVNEPLLRRSEVYRLLRQHCADTQVIVDAVMDKAASRD